MLFFDKIIPWLIWKIFCFDMEKTVLMKKFSIATHYLQGVPLPTFQEVITQKL